MGTTKVPDAGHISAKKFERAGSSVSTADNISRLYDEFGHDGGSISGSKVTSDFVNLDQFSYTAYEQWIKKEIKVRECCVFIKKADGELEPICYCGNVRSAHGEGIQILGEGEKWDKTTHTTLTECQAYGKINFLDEDTTKQPEYLRIASDYGDRKNIQRVEKLLQEFWNLTQPGLLISVIGGNKSFNVSHDICVHFEHGLLNAAKSTNGWIITSGQDEGVTKLVGDVIGRSTLTSRIYTIGVARWGKTWNKEMLLRKNNRYNEFVTDYASISPEGGTASLEPNHSHFFLVDDGTTDDSGVELKFRGELEFLITKMYEKDNVPLPMICIMLEGGSQSIHMALNSLRMGQPLVVIKGSGRAADIICYACEITTFKEDFVDGQFTVRGVLSDEDKRDLQDMLEACFSKFKECNTIENLLLAVVEIASFKKSITIYKIDSPEPLDFAILSSLMKSIGESAARMRQMKLAITWGHEKVAKELIFEKKDYKFKTEELDSLLMFSIVNRRVGFVKLLLDYGADLKHFVTAPQLTKLYNILPKNSGAYRLLVRYDRAISLRDIGELMEVIMEGTYHSVLTHDRFNQDMSDDDRFDNPYDLMVIYSALIDASDMSKFFWENSRTPIATALIAHKVFLYLDKMEARWARIDEEMTEKLEKSASDFEKLAIGIITICYHNYEKQDWVQILVVPLKEWGGLNLFDLATIIEAKNFIAHAAYQSYLTDIWMGQIKPSTSPFKLLFCMIPPLQMLLNFNKLPMSMQDKARKMLRGVDIPARRKRLEADVEYAPQMRADDGPENELQVRGLKFKEKLYYFYTSPIIKFYLSTMTYLMFLLLYGYGLLVKNPSLVINEDGSRLEWQDLYTFVFVISTVPVEITQISNSRTKDKWKKVKDHFGDTYNLMDFIAVCMFMTAFILKASTPYEKETNFDDEINRDEMISRNLNVFGLYHANRLLSAMCFSFYCFRFVQMFEINDNIGPKVFMLKKMSIDLFFFLFLLMVFTVSYGVSSQALLYPFRETSGSKVFFELLQRSYLNVFGEIDLDGFGEHLQKGHCYAYKTYTNFSKYSPEKNITADYSSCSQEDLLQFTRVGKVNYYVAFTLLSLYLLVVNVMLINLLIAIFSNTYENVEQQSGIIYKTQRAAMILEFRERPPLPNPVSLLYFGLILGKWFYNKYFKRSDYERDLQKFMSSMPNRHSSVAYRSSLMEAECRAQFIRKNKSETGNLIVSALSSTENGGIERSQYNDLAAKLSRIETQLASAIEKISHFSAAVDVKNRAPGLHPQGQDDTNLAETETQKKGWGLISKPMKIPAGEQAKATLEDIFKRVKSKRSLLSQRDSDHSSSAAADTWLNTLTHTLSLSTPYPGTKIERFPLQKNQIHWTNKFEEYTPPTFDNTEIPHLDTVPPTEVRFNRIDNDGVDRISYCGKYDIVDGHPRNPKGRTGMSGRGNLPRWGPNHMAITIITRFKEVRGGPPAHTVSILTKQNKPVMEVLLISMEGSEYEVFPQGFLAPKESLRHCHQRVVFDMCYDFSNQNEVQQRQLLASLEKIFKSQKEVTKSYMDDPMNTDNAWIEVSVASAHDSDNVLPSAFKYGRGVSDIKWVTVLEKPTLHQNLTNVLKRALKVIKAYTPYDEDATEPGPSSSLSK